ncbi:MAG: hypothetical protein OXF02_03165 [Simkaniaceae bacterium]|nr:hypothetical protein [Simkaniaceae bacterium]
MFEFFTKRWPTLTALLSTLSVAAGFGLSRLHAERPPYHHRVTFGRVAGEYTVTHRQEKAKEGVNKRQKVAKDIRKETRFVPGFDYEYLRTNRPYLHMGWSTETDSSLQFGKGYAAIGYSVGSGNGSYVFSYYLGVGYVNKPSDAYSYIGGLRCHFLVADNMEIGLFTEVDSSNKKFLHGKELPLNTITVRAPLSWYPFDKGKCGITLTPVFSHTLNEGQGINRRYSYGATLGISFRV